MFCAKIGRALSRRVALDASSRFARVPRLETAIRRRYGDDKSDKFIESDKYKVFKDDDSSVILDVEEERALLDSQVACEDLDFEPVDKFAGFNTSRGVSGVYEVEELVEVLRKNNVSNIFVASVPSNVKYVDYIVIASGRSRKHLMAVVEFVHILFKKKRKSSDNIPRIVNKKPIDWVALDMGNIALHLLTREIREEFDLESIWSVGEEFDSHLNKPADSLVTLLNEHSFSLHNLEPADVEHTKNA